MGGKADPKVGRKQQKQDMPFHLKCIIPDAKRVGRRKKQIQKGKTVLYIHNPDIIPDKLKADFSKRIRNTVKKIKKK